MPKTNSPSSAAAAPPALLGSVTPRLFTPPLVAGPPGPCGCGCALTPETSIGFDKVAFAAMIGWPLRPWQRWAAIHGGELLPDGRPRFRKLLIIVARQNGKTVTALVDILYWLYVDQVPLVVGTHADRAKAKKTWTRVTKLAETHPRLRQELARVHRRDTTGEEDFWTTHAPDDCVHNGRCEHDCHYQFAAPTKNAARGDTLDRALVDELRQMDNHDAWSALTNAMNAVRTAQLVAISNMGGPSAVVLHELRDAALTFIRTGQGDRRTGLLEWSAPPGSDPEDLTALAMANPDLGGEIDADVLLGEAALAKSTGGELLDEFTTEVMCLPRELLKTAIDLDMWAQRGPSEAAPAIDLTEHRDRLVLCLDVAHDGTHVTLAGAAVVDGKVHVGIITGWDSTATMRAELPTVIEAIKPRALVWFPNGPAAGVMGELASPRRRSATAKRWPPYRVKLVEITSASPAVCMGFVEQIETDELRHDGHILGTTHVGNAVRRARGDVWVFDRRGTGHVDALYAMAGAVHEARVLPGPPVPLRSVR